MSFMTQLNAGSAARVAGISVDGLCDLRIEEVRIRPYAINDADRLNGMSRRLAELAVLICDPWQRHGLARLLVGCLIPVAARRGITGFRAEVMTDNAGATRAVRS